MDGNIYSSFIENLDDPTFRVDLSKHTSFEAKVTAGLVNIWHKKDGKVYDMLSSEVEFDRLSDFEKSLMLEAKISELWFKEHNLEKVIPIAQETFSLNQHAMICKMILMEKSFNEGEYESGISLWLENLKDYPKAKWTHLFLVRILFSRRKIKLARRYIGNISNPVWRIIYFFTIRIFLPFFWLFIFGYLYALFQPNGYWVILAFYIPLGFFTIYTRRKNEIPLINFYTYFFGAFTLLTVMYLGSSYFNL